MSGLILYTSEDGRSRIRLRADDQTVGLTQAEMAELFDVTVEHIRQHLKNVFPDKALEPERTSEESFVVRQAGARHVPPRVAHSALPMASPIQEHALGAADETLSTLAPRGFRRLRVQAGQPRVLD